MIGDERPGRPARAGRHGPRADRRLRLELAPGLNVLTGETGAGKSLLIDALGLALGARADTTLVRHGAETARVEALFDRVPGAADRRPRGRRGRPLDGPAGRRDGHRGAARRDDRAAGRDPRPARAAAPARRALAARPARCLRRARGRRATAIADAVERWRVEPGRAGRAGDRPARAGPTARAAGARGRRDRRGPPPARRGRRDPGTARRGAARRGDRAWRRRAGRGAGRRGGRRAGRDRRRRSARPARWPGSTPGSSRSRSGWRASRRSWTTSRARPAALAEAVDHDPAELARLEERLSAIYALERRYGEDEAAVIAHGERAAAEAERLRGLEGERDRRAAQDGRSSAASPRGRRRAVGEAHGRGRGARRRVGAVLVELGFPAGVFDVGPGPRPAGTGRARGRDRRRRRGLRRVGHRPGRLPARAQPGRAAAAAGPDRVRRRAVAGRARDQAGPRRRRRHADAGLRRGRHRDRRPQRGPGRDGALWALARRHQVLCVTHLPQIAAYADAHFRIAKRERDGRTVTEVTRLDREGRIVELAPDARRGRRGGDRGAGVRARAARPGRRRGAPSCWRRSRLTAVIAPTTSRSSQAIGDYLAFLRVERGLAAATIAAYRGDLRDFAGPPRDGRVDWADSPEPPSRYLAARTRRGAAPARPGSRRRASGGGPPSIRGFYRFAFGEGLIGVDVAARLDLPRQPRLLPETLTVDEVERLLEAAGAGRRRARWRPSATGRCSSCSTPPASGSARRSAWIGRTCRSTAAFVRVDRQGRPGAARARSATSALDWLRALAGRRPPGAARARHHVEPRLAAARCSSAIAAGGSRASRRGRP